DIRTNAKINSLDGLFAGGYNAIFLAIGAHQGAKLRIEGEDSPEVMEGISFLREINMGNKVRVGNKVAIIGGGNVAIDASRNALRLGAKEVTIIYRRTRTEMPASEEEINEAIHEGVKIEFLAAPIRMESKDSVVELICIRMKLGAVDTSGRRRPVPIEGSEFSSSFNTVIAAIGQMPETPDQFGLPLGRGNTFQVDTYLAMINCTIWSRDGTYYLLILDLELELAANSTIWASSNYFTVRQALPLISSFHQGSGRTSINTSSTEFTAYFLKRLIESGAYQSFTPSIGKGDGSHLTYLLTHTDAATTKNAQVIISVEEWVFPVNGELLISIRESYFLQSDIASNPL
ncbi:unnamed protein product, partial [marine sediment metagenome]